MCGSAAWWSLISIFILWLTIYTVYSHYIRPYYVIKRRLRLLGPPPKLFLGNYSDMEKSGYLGSIQKWAALYRPTFITYLGIKPVIVTEDLDIIKSVLVKNFDSFMNRMNVPELLRKVPGITRLRDEQWRKVRRTMSPTFSTKKLRMMSPLIQESCERLRNKVAAVSNTNSTVDVWKWFGLFTMEVILATAFSRDISLENSEDNVLIKAAASMFKATNGPDLERLIMLISHSSWLMPFLIYFAKKTEQAQSVHYLEETALKLIKDRRDTMESTESTSKDFLQLMLEAHEENIGTKSSGILSNDEIVSAIMTTILAGYETTSNTLSYTAYLLALNPTIQDNLVKEINDYYEANPDPSLYDAAENIEYVNMVLCESLRMFPPAPRTSRECNKTCAITDDLVVEEGIVISFPIFSLHHNAEYWPNPEKFDPERFNPNNEQSYPTFAYLPFGEGPRNCIGKRLALLEAKMTLVAILKDLQFKRCADTEVPLDLRVGVTMSPSNGIKLSIVSNPV